jgi:hypothetical protein
MIELPSWFLFVVGVAVFAAGHRRRPETAFLYDGAEFAAVPMRSRSRPSAPWWRRAARRSRASSKLTKPRFPLRTKADPASGGSGRSP